MTRDELIEELKKCPTNAEVAVVAEEESECNTCGEMSLHVSDFKIEGVDTIPALRIRVFEKRLCV